MASKEPRFIIVKTISGEKGKFLRHEGHKHLWTQNRGDAMEYTRLDVAQALADQQSGQVQPI